MTLPVTYSTWEDRQFLCHGGRGVDGSHLIVGKRRYCYSQRQAIQWCADWLIARLYTPCSLSRHPWGTVRAGNVDSLTRPYKVRDEPINWGDLGACVERRGGTFVVTLEEAAADSCPALCAYVADWLKEWGWKNVTVETTW